MKLLRKEKKEIYRRVETGKSKDKVKARVRVRGRGRGRVKARVRVEAMGTFERNRMSLRHLVRVLR